MHVCMLYLCTMYVCNMYVCMYVCTCVCCVVFVCFTIFVCFLARAGYWSEDNFLILHSMVCVSIQFSRDIQGTFWSITKEPLHDKLPRYSQAYLLVGIFMNFSEIMCQTFITQ